MEWAMGRHPADYLVDRSGATCLTVCRYCPVRIIRNTADEALAAMRIHQLQAHSDRPGVYDRIKQQRLRSRR